MPKQPRQIRRDEHEEVEQGTLPHSLVPRQVGQPEIEDDRIADISLDRKLQSVAIRPLLQDRVYEPQVQPLGDKNIESLHSPTERRDPVVIGTVSLAIETKPIGQEISLR